MAQLPAARQGAKNIKAILDDRETVLRFRQIVPRHLNPERMLRVMAHCVYKTPLLAECNPLTLLGAMQVCASLGLEPNTPLQHAFLIPFKNNKKKTIDVNLIIGYRGYVDLARRSGQLVNLHADVVVAGDDFSFEYGSDQHLRHRPNGLDGQEQWAYAYARLKDGDAFEVMPYSAVLKIRDKTQAYKQALADKASGKDWAYAASPWVAYPAEMAKKTAVRRLAKWLPLSLEFANAAALDQMSETGRADLTVFAGDGALEVDAAIAIEDARQDDAETVDPETGEVNDGAPDDTPAQSPADDAKPAGREHQQSGGRPHLFGDSDG